MTELRKLLDYMVAGGKPFGTAEEKWPWKELGKNLSLTSKLILTYSSLPWPEKTQQEYGLLPLTKLRERFLRKGKYRISEIQHLLVDGQIGMDQRAMICQNPHIRMADILEQPRIYWRNERLSNHRELTIKLILNPPANWLGKFDFDEVSYHAQITWEDVQAHPELPWNHRRMSGNRNIRIATILAHRDLFDNLWPINFNPNLTLADLPALSEEDYALVFIAGSATFTLEEFLAYLPKTNLAEWGDDLYKRPSLPVDYLLTLPPKGELSAHPELTLAQILANPDYPWNTRTILKHLGNSTFFGRKEAAKQEMKNHRSYLSYLPADMFLYYLSLYIRS